MNDYKTIYIKEWSKLSAEFIKNKYNVIELTKNDFNILSQLENKIKITQLARGIEIESNSYVGVIKLNKFQLIIKPKMKNTHLAKMVAFAYDLHNIDILDENITLGAEKADISDIIAVILLQQTEKLYYQGLRKRYQEKEEEIRSCRGKINFNRLAKNSFTSLTLPCRFQELTVDIEENQIVLSALKMLMPNINNSELRKRINKLFSLLNNEVTLKNFNEELLKQAYNKIDRLNNNYQNIFKVIKLLLTNKDFNLIRSKNHDFIGFLLDMNLLFERFLYQYFKKNLCSDLKIKYQKSLKNIFQVDNFKNTNLTPDYQFYENAKLKKIADAKYKNYQDKKVSANDLYQLSTYAFANQEKIDQVYLFYPAAAMKSDNYFLKNNSRNTEIKITAKGIDLEKILASIDNNNIEIEIFD
ncbi:MAG: McrC family protein [Nanoarchaeota archaeon]